MLILKIAIAAAALYAVVVAIAYVAQTAMLFPTRFAGGWPETLPPGAERLSIAAADGEELIALRLPAALGAAPGRPMVIGFGGNAWNAAALAFLLHRLAPGYDVVVPYYRGYAPSGGRPSAADLLADAVTVYDRLAPSEGVIAAGFSIGAGVAAHLAAERPVAGLILVTPFDSLTALASHHYPWLPIRLLFRHRIETVEALRLVRAPTAIITAEHDTIVPARRSQPVADGIARLVYRATIANAGHNDLYDRPAFAEAMAEAIARIEAAR